MSKLIRKVLIANRGEIACRILRTAKRLGIQTVAIHSDIDKNSKFVSMADEAFRVGGNPSLESYLNSTKIIQIAKESGCEALHPGFGFLSENAGFAEECFKNGIQFIGPPSSAIIQMGSKSASKNIMTAAKVPVVPGYHQSNQDPSYLLSEAKNIGFPVLIKAVSGGGGKGMRIVTKQQDFYQSLQSCKRQALKAFKDDNVLVQKYITRPRHIEVQIFGDKLNNHVHLFERDCSIQRRHQKVVQQAPSNVSEAIRQNIYDSAVNAAKAVGYYNAGTVEFIFDLDSNKHYFMEMNTRLQVEHPITQMITGEDLVEWQFLVASGFRLPKLQNEIKHRGYAIQSRVYSENPFNGFLPGNGKLKYFREPIEKQKSVRIETGVRENDQISTFYDPMIAKLITYGPTRQDAISSMKKALAQYRVVGLPTNLKFLKNVLKNEVFERGDYDTSFIEKNKDTLIQKIKSVDNFDLASAVAAKLASQFGKINLPHELIGFRNGSLLSQNLIIKASASFFESNITTKLLVQVVSHNKAIVTINKQAAEVEFNSLSKNVMSVTYRGRTVKRQYFEEGERISLFDSNGDTIDFEFQNNQLKVVKSETVDTKIFKTPMPGTVIKIFVKPGDNIKKGSPVFIMEAMKMEHTIRATNDAVVKAVFCKENSLAEADTIVVELQ